MKKIILIIFTISAFLIASKNGFSQISTKEIPKSFSLDGYNQDKNTLTSVNMPKINLDQLRKEDEEDAKNGIPPRFGYQHKVDLTIYNSGKWTTLSNGDRIWQLAINCPEALSINLLYNEFWLPEGGKLFIFNKNTKQSIGAFTNKNNKGTKSKPGQFTTGLVYGDNIILEYLEPKNTESKAVISIGYVIQGYRYIKLPYTLESGFGNSGPCQVNVNCPEGNNWQSEKEAVALIIVNGNRYCTGSLINNTANDFTPYFLTADHCLGGWANSSKLDAITNSNANLWSFYWNYQSPECSNTIDPPVLSTVGATVVANNSISDFALLRLTEDPRNVFGINLYYLGWDHSGNTDTGGVGIHHPNGDVKKIATHTSTPSSNGNFWNLYWSNTQSGYSVTEGGSSGSPLINNSRKIIGQLYGGSSINCNDPSKDLGIYGKFSVSWTGLNATDSRRRLRDWLDPINLNISTLNGIDCFGNLLIQGPSQFCDSAIYSIPNLPSGTSISWSIEGYGAEIVSSSGNQVTVVGDYYGEFRVKANVTSTCGTFVTKSNLIVFGFPYTVGITQVSNDGMGTSWGELCSNSPNYDNYYNTLSYTVQSNISTPASYPLTLNYVFYDENGDPHGATSTSISSGTGSVNLPNLSPGFYSLQVWLSGGPCNTSSEWTEEWIEYTSCGNFTRLITFPNPSNETLIISYKGDESFAKTNSLKNTASEEKHLLLFDDKGKEVKKDMMKAGDTKLEWDIKNLPSGRYFLHINEGKEVIKKQIIIKH
ncbi:protease 1 [Pedobacter glucosidilyticus]|nr:T9SS type A sorting domain-containing protein [Pedobacter glucosidilyticus]KHJ36618.1 protease 1 [Pedobacter glucosidilyticus]